MAGAICIFTAQYLPVMGGVERYSHALAQRLAAEGRGVVIVTSSQPGLPPEETQGTLRVLRLPSVSLLGGRLPLPKPGRAARALEQALAVQPIESVLVQTRLYPLCLLGVRFAHRRGIPCLLLDHGSSHVDMGNPVASCLGRRYEHWLTRRIQTHCRHFYGVSQSSADWLAHFGIRADGVLHNAIAPSEIDALLNAPGPDFRQTLGMSADAILVCYAGRMLAMKGVDALAGAVHALEEQGENIHLALAGEGPLESSLRQHPSGRVHVLGRLPQAGLVHLLRQSDLFCLPTRSEGLPSSVLEAVLCGCYVVTTRSGGQAEVLPGDDYATFLTGMGREEIEEGLRQALRLGRAAREEAAARAKRRVCACFTWEKTTQDVLAAFAALDAAEAS